jgi:hypothetical protein
MIFVRGDCGTGCRTQGAAENRTVTATEFVADCCPGGAAETPPDGRVQRRVVRADIGRQDQHR